MPKLPGLALMGVLLMAAPLRAAEDVTGFTLENGLQVVVIEDHRAPVVVQMLWYKVGSADEPRGKSGIAHFLEHLMFKGTDELGPGEFSEIVEAQGGNDNAFTSYDYTAYFQRVAADRLDLMMQMEADRMTDLQLNAEDVATERQVILEERSQRTDSSPGALLGEQMRAAQFLNHPYGIPIIGWRHEMEGLTQQDAIDHYKAHYAPNNAVLVVAGDVTPDQVRSLAEKHYGPIPAAPDLRPRNRVAEPPQLAERRIAMADPRVSEPYISRSYLAPERDPGDQETAAALTILAELLGGSGTTSVLARALQFDQQKAVYTAAFYDGSTVDDTTFNFIVVPTPETTLEQAEAAMDAAIADFIANGPDPDAFARIKTQIRASEIYARDDSNGLARRYGEGLANGLSIEDVKNWPEVLNAVTPEDVVAAAKLVLDRRKAVTGYLMREEAAQ
ncbi:M16 family metallopeptidase [Paragemmobacter ruber]|uniref:Insulinase family protein n=1 Tax=Paragemmobacter ruber TaxID=1985673 RepID=A0ABW9Y3T2_9RHOB|nr:pitrilysin family protein [Rhodobacter ruber]NBE07149.1 insulinase family protein [Rhodobacter ruber]